MVSNYAQAAIDAVNDEIPHLDPDLAPLYALLAVVKGEETSLVDVHDAWSIWRTRTQPEHPSIVLFSELSEQVQELDRQYAEGIQRAAQRIKL